MEHLTPHEPAAHSHHSSGHSLLYNPNNWFFYSFVLGAFVPAIFYMRNCRLLGKAEEGTKILLTVIGTFVVAMVVGGMGMGRLVGFAFWLGWLLFFRKKGQEQKPLYEERKKEHPQAVRPKEWPVVVIFIAIGVAIGMLSAMSDKGYMNYFL